MHSVVDINEVRPRKLPQLIASLSASIGVLAAGLVFGWSSSAGEDGENLRYSFEIDSIAFSWISSIYDIAGAAVCIPTGIVIHLIGRRTVMLILTVPFTIGWACVIWPSSLEILILGRGILGASSGALFVTVPTYTAEISDKETRGKLSSYISIHFYTGILIAYSLSLLDNMFVQSLISVAVPFFFCVVFFFMPESPTYYLMKGNVNAARDVLIWLRGSQYDVESELEEKIDGLVEEKRSKRSFFVALKSPAKRKAHLIGYGLAFFQSFSGTDAILAYASSIFADATGSDGDLPAVIVSAMQLVALFLFSGLVDKWGRRVLLLLSGSVMSLSMLVLGTYFYFYENGFSMDDFKWIPLVCISCFLVSFSIGFESIPWIINELFSLQHQGAAWSSVYAANWFMVFMVVKSFSQGTDAIGFRGVFWLYSAIIALGIVFVYFLLPETKNKSLEQIQIELRGDIDDYSNTKSKCIKF